MVSQWWAWQYVLLQLLNLKSGLVAVETLLPVDTYQPWSVLRDLRNLKFLLQSRMDLRHQAICSSCDHVPDFAHEDLSLHELEPHLSW